MSLPSWARAHGPLLFAARIRSSAQDFRVTEDLGVAFSGDGEHDVLSIEKTGANTEWVARQLAHHAGVPAKDVGYSGLKDRHAVTRQWFSVPRWNKPDWSQLVVEGTTLLEQARHSRKLRRGTHKANHFAIVLRGEDLQQHVAALRERVVAIELEGVPNYFGEQRFGRNGANLILADAWASGKRLPRHKRSIAISSVRSFLFNEVLDARVRDATWNRVLRGDFANLDGTGSVFTVDTVDAEIERRCAEMDIHPAVELAGESSGIANEAWAAALNKARVKPGTRSMRLPIKNLQMLTDDESVTLTFSLGRGAFATSVLREIVEVTNAAPEAAA